MMEITLDEFCNHWVQGRWDTVMASKLATNVFNFVTAAGDYSHQIFTSSFINGSFCGGTPWAPRTSRWGKRFTHPVLIDSGILSKSVKFSADRVKIKGRRDDGTRITRLGAKYSIWTTEKSVDECGKKRKKGTKVENDEKCKRGKSKERYGHYAAIHNTDPAFGLYTVNQHSTRRPVHRQFIGFNQSVDDYIDTHFVDKIFEGFPHDKR